MHNTIKLTSSVSALVYPNWDCLSLEFHVTPLRHSSFQHKPYSVQWTVYCVKASKCTIMDTVRKHFTPALQTMMQSGKIACVPSTRIFALCTSWSQCCWETAITIRSFHSRVVIGSTAEAPAPHLLPQAWVTTHCSYSKRNILYLNYICNRFGYY